MADGLCALFGFCGRSALRDVANECPLPGSLVRGSNLRRIQLMDAIVCPNRSSDCSSAPADICLFIRPASEIGRSTT